MQASVTLAETVRMKSDNEIRRVVDDYVKDQVQSTGSGKPNSNLIGKSKAKDARVRIARNIEKEKEQHHVSMWYKGKLYHADCVYDLKQIAFALFKEHYKNRERMKNGKV